MIPEIRIEDYNYILPDTRIAKYPLNSRDASKLLIYKDGTCADALFKNLPESLPDGSIMVFNDTRVVPARLFFRRNSGARIEIFCLQPYDPEEYNLAFASVGRCSWECVLGNVKRWKDDLLYFDSDDPEIKEINLQARLIR